MSLNSYSPVIRCSYIKKFDYLDFYISLNMIFTLTLKKCSKGDTEREKHQQVSVSMA